MCASPTAPLSALSEFRAKIGRGVTPSKVPRTTNAPRPLRPLRPCLSGTPLRLSAGFGEGRRGGRSQTVKHASSDAPAAAARAGRCGIQLERLAGALWGLPSQPGRVAALWHGARPASTGGASGEWACRRTGSSSTQSRRSGPAPGPGSDPDKTRPARSAAAGNGLPEMKARRGRRAGQTGAPWGIRGACRRAFRRAADGRRMLSARRAGGRRGGRTAQAPWHPNLFNTFQPPAEIPNSLNCSAARVLMQCPPSRRRSSPGPPRSSPSRSGSCPPRTSPGSPSRSPSTHRCRARAPQPRPAGSGRPSFRRRP